MPTRVRPTTGSRFVAVAPTSRRASRQHGSQRRATPLEQTPAFAQQQSRQGRRQKWVSAEQAHALKQQISTTRAGQSPKPQLWIERIAKLIGARGKRIALKGGARTQQLNAHEPVDRA